MRGWLRNQSPKGHRSASPPDCALPVGVLGLQRRQEGGHGAGIVAGGAEIADPQLVGLELLLARVALDVGLGPERADLAGRLAAELGTLRAAEIAAQEDAGELRRRGAQLPDLGLVVALARYGGR